MIYPEQLGFQSIHRIGLLFFGLGLAVMVLELVRRDLLREKYALLWLITAGVGLFVGVFPQIIIILSSLFRFQYLTVIVVGALVFLFGLVLSFTIVLSRLAERSRRLTQEIALLKHELARLAKSDDS
ncbi:MAG TPA: DUF2304 domain-containing protein [Candidatus Hydrogenedentes bacterium]|nr:DUF2304 domain-containing protein [Candidatus Hydrogenedentota bacterium]HOL75810.1 DUF2304 domain-containing protein [Candidatus Hydrogenedentota bacterium]HPO87185.1 DUF2304 domain-containing protein [Candidatus Hydrogenedentota bacterium]